MGFWSEKIRSFLGTRAGQLTLAAGVAIGATAGVVSLESNRRIQGHQVLALRIAQQSAAQAEALVLGARQNRERDPIGWALSRLAQGGDSRVIRVSRTRVAAESPAESGDWNDDTGTLVFRKRLPSEDGESGGTWWVQVGFLGFMGARSRFTSELGALVVFFFLMGVVYRALKSQAHVHAPVQESEPLASRPPLLDLSASTDQGAGPSLGDVSVIAAPPTFDLARIQANHAAALESLQDSLDPRIDRTHEGFVRVTRQVRDLLLRVQQFAIRARNSERELEACRQRQYSTLREVHDARTWLMQSARGSEALEEALKRVDFEVYRSGLPQSNIHQVIESALDRAVSYRMGLQSCQAVVGRLESVLEPRVMDLDEVASSFRAAMSELGAVCATVPPAAEALVAQAQTLEELESAIRAEIAQRAAA